MSSIKFFGCQLWRDGRPQHVGTPMHGIVARIALKTGHRVSKGSLLTTIEAMKMKTQVHAEVDGVIGHMDVKQSDAVTAKSLLMGIFPLPA
jgi:pyruvate carboxylase